jgi:hypothetical protein
MQTSLFSRLAIFFAVLRPAVAEKSLRPVARLSACHRRDNHVTVCRSTVPGGRGLSAEYLLFSLDEACLD